jgi:hypothetical protein
MANAEQRSNLAPLLIREFDRRGSEVGRHRVVKQLRRHLDPVVDYSLHRLGRTRFVNRVVITSDRRVAAWGALRANWIYLKVGARWGLGFRKGLERHYPDIR